MQQLKPNTTLQGGKYRIERALGQGGFGNTYEGTNTIFDEQIAIKEFFMQGINDRDNETGSVSVSLEGNKQQFEEQREKFRKEALRIRKLNNPHIIKVHDLFEENGTAYYVMDYVDGENLAERLKRTGKPMSEQEVQKLLPQILDALKSVHDAAIWHLDLKPANIMVDKAGNVVLIDFGASKQFNVQKGGATTSTAISYTNGYAPREQMEQNYDKFGPWTDLYALGATLYTLLTNKRPPLPTDIDDDVSDDKHLALPLPEGVSKKMCEIIIWMMQTNRLKRPQSVGEIETKIESHPVSEHTSPNESQDEETIIADVHDDVIKVPNNAEETELESNSDEILQQYGEVGKYNKPAEKEEDSNDDIWTVLLWILLLGSLFVCIFVALQKCIGSSYSYEDPQDTIEEVIDTMAVEAGPLSGIGRPEGVGKASFEDEYYYKGYFEKAMNLSSSKAYFKYPNGDVFRGTYQDNAIYFGTYTIAKDGRYFIGRFKNGQPDEGTWYDKKGNRIE